MYIQQSNQKLILQNQFHQQYQTRQHKPVEQNDYSLSLKQRNEKNEIKQFQELQTSSSTMNARKRKRKQQKKQQQIKQNRQRQTKVIMVKPSMINNQNGQFEQQQVGKNDKLKIKKQVNSNNMNKIAIHNLQSPILYRFSDDDDNEDQDNNNQKNSNINNDNNNSNRKLAQTTINRQYSIPQSSRRWFKQYQQEQYQQRQQQQQKQQVFNRDSNQKSSNNHQRRRKQLKSSRRQNNNTKNTTQKQRRFYNQQHQDQQYEQQQQNQKHYAKQEQQQRGTEYVFNKQPIIMGQSKVYCYDQGDDNQINDSDDDENDNNDHNDQEQQQLQQEQQQQNHQHSQHPKKLTILKSPSFYTLTNAQIPKNNFINCVIKRKRSSNNNKFFNLQMTVVYQMFLLQDKKFLISCVKNRLHSLTNGGGSRFQFVRERVQSDNNNKHNDFSKKFTNNSNINKQNLYAILTSNFTGTEYVLKTIVKNDTISQKSTAIDKSDMLLKIDQSTTAMGESLNSPKKGGVKLFAQGQNKFTKQHDIEQNKQEIKQSCFISFKANLFNLGGQRQVKLIKKKNKKIIKTNKFSDLKQAYQNKQLDKIQQLHNKKAFKGKNGFQLDFQNHAKMQSSKNIILQTQQYKQALIFGKIKQDIYSIAIGYPLSIVEGLAFAVANLDRKLFVN